MLFDPRDRAVQYFRLLLPAELAHTIAGSTGNPIHRLELGPVLIAILLWSERLKDVPALWFIDNDGARSALVAGGGHTDEGAAIVHLVDDEAARIASLPWYDRAPSASNPADAPSRGEAPCEVAGWPAPTEAEISTEIRERVLRLL